jgi:hypothetical protein
VKHVCEELVQPRFKMDGITNAIYVYWKLGSLDLSLALHDDMRAIGCTPYAVTYTVLIDSLRKIDRIANEAHRLIKM